MVDDEYRPKLCGDCDYFTRKCAERDPLTGRLIGRCKLMKSNVARTDWCHRREETREHKKAMKAYKGEQKWS